MLIHIFSSALCVPYDQSIPRKAAPEGHSGDFDEAELLGSSIVILIDEKGDAFLRKYCHSQATLTFGLLHTEKDTCATEVRYGGYPGALTITGSRFVDLGDDSGDVFL